MVERTTTSRADPGSALSCAFLSVNMLGTKHTQAKHLATFTARSVSCSRHTEVRDSKAERY